MALTSKHQVKIPGADKTQAAALAIEFWTGKGFIVHTSPTFTVNSVKLSF